MLRKMRRSCLSKILNVRYPRTLLQVHDMIVSSNLKAPFVYLRRQTKIVLSYISLELEKNKSLI